MRFEQRDVSKGLPATYDLITTFDVIHDAADPRGLLRVIRDGLDAGRHYLCLDINCSDKLEENAGPLGTLFYGVCVLYCMTTSLAQGGEGSGTAGLHPHEARRARERGRVLVLPEAPAREPVQQPLRAAVRTR